MCVFEHVLASVCWRACAGERMLASSCLKVRLRAGFCEHVFASTSLRAFVCVCQHVFVIMCL